MVITLLSIVLVLAVIGVLTKVIHSISKNGVKVAFKKNIISIIAVCIASVMMIGYVVIGSNNIERKDNGGGDMFPATISQIVITIYGACACVCFNFC